MGGPAWLSDTFAAAMLVIAAYCAARLTVAAARWRETELDADVMHLAMGLAMAGMLAPGLRFASPATWTGVFGVTGAWFAWQAVRVRRGLGAGRWRCPYPVPHLAESLAMVYMLLAVRPPGGTGSDAGMAGMAGMGGASGLARAPELAMVFAVFMVGYVAWLGDRLTSVATVAPVDSPAGPAIGESPPRPALGRALTRPATAGAPGGASTGAGGAAPSLTTPAGGCWPVLAPRGASCYKIAMAIVMGYMLIVML